jgi:hypothetical protein
MGVVAIQTCITRAYFLNHIIEADVQEHQNKVDFESDPKKKDEL